jgi:ATP-dependent DNA helicase RecG
LRPEILFTLFALVETLAGVGPRFAKLIGLLAGPKVVDLCWHLPSGIIDRRYAPKLAEAEADRVATLTLEVAEHLPPQNPRHPYRVVCRDDTGRLDLVFFHGHADYLRRVLPPGETRAVSGKLEVFAGKLQMTHPDHIGPVDELAEMAVVEPVYPLTTGLTQNFVRKAVRSAMAEAKPLPEWLDPPFHERQRWPAWLDSLKQAHAPKSEAELSPLSPARRRLAYDELLANQLALALIRAHQAKKRGRAVAGSGHLQNAVIASLPFELTGAQRQAIEEIAADMAARRRMLRLLQGDVGSGKTLVALLSMLNAVEAGHQAVIMAPTEILARQHFATIDPLARAAGVTVELVTGRDKGKTREAKLRRLSSGEASIVIGTHALFQKDVEFHDLALAVIDEQHRFGVHQRLDLTSKGSAVDVLVMTATPIPRTLVLTAYGDMDTSRLMEKPPGRRPVDTRVLPLARLGGVIDAVGRAIKDGTKVYWICPLVQESEVSDLAAAEERYRDLAARYREAVGLVHGQMKSKDKDAVMASFADGDLAILVATTVIEVGVDVPRASIMVVEHAERFGLAQLHQLRGRVGRGGQQATCLLLYQGPLGDTARARLGIMRDSDDGFRIAEEDLRLRGAGELLGTRQSGMPEFRLADIGFHEELLAAARDDARLILSKDPDLQSARGAALRILLYLFERDTAVKFLRSG